MTMNIPYAATRALEVTLSAMMGVCGVVLVLPGETFSLPQYQLVTFFFNEIWGGVILIVSSVVGGGALWVNGNGRPSPIFRLARCIVGASFWATLCVALFESSSVLKVFPLMMGVSFVLFIAEFYSGVRCGADASHLRTFGRHKGR